MPPWLMDRWWDIGKTATFYAITSLFSYRMTGVHNVRCECSSRQR